MALEYDSIGVGYSFTRRPDPHIAAQILLALDGAGSVVNVGAGTGSYEPSDRFVVAVEPSSVMIRQRPASPAGVVQAAAENLPLPDSAVDAAMAILTIHHWTHPLRGLAEMRRVARSRVVVLTWDPDVFERFWLIQEYFPCVRALHRPRALTIAEIASALKAHESISVPIPHDCADGFLGAFWQRPDAYLNAQVRSGISAYAEMASVDRDNGLARLAADIESGAWESRHGELWALSELDLGYRLIVA